MRLICAALALLALGLEPREVVVVANRNSAASREVADHYLAKRNVPRANLVLLDLPEAEEMSRADFDARLLKPLRAALQERRGDLKTILTVYGVPLRVGEAAGQSESLAAVDSELMLLWWDGHPTARWLWNPKHWRYPADKLTGKPPVLTVARLDGPTPAIAKRLVDDAIAAERDGLAGQVYIDARGLKYDPAGNPGHDLAGYDASMRETAKLLEAGKFRVTLDDRDALFLPNSCPDCALYCGWYSLKNYVPAFKFKRGAVAWHLASYECESLRGGPENKQWCKSLLEAGACATLGPVAEPYTIGFPKPAEFFGLLATGELPLAECFARTVPTVSWRTTLIGDPLYNPFAKSKPLPRDRVKPSPAGGILPFDLKPPSP